MTWADDVLNQLAVWRAIREVEVRRLADGEGHYMPVSRPVDAASDRSLRDAAGDVAENDHPALMFRKLPQCLGDLRADRARELMVKFPS